MRVLRPIVEASADLVPTGCADFIHRHRISPKRVGDDAPRSAMCLHDPLEKLQRGSLVPPCGDHGLEDLAFMVDCAPQVQPSDPDPDALQSIASIRSSTSRARARARAVDAAFLRLTTSPARKIAPRNGRAQLIASALLGADPLSRPWGADPSSSQHSCSCPSSSHPSRLNAVRLATRETRHSRHLPVQPITVREDARVDAHPSPLAASGQDQHARNGIRKIVMKATRMVDQFAPAPHNTTLEMTKLRDQFPVVGELDKKFELIKGRKAK